MGLKRVIRKIGFRIDTLILAALKSNIEVGLFHGVYKIVQSASSVAEGSLQAVFPIFSKYYGTSQESFDLAYEKSFKFLTIIGIPFAVFLSFFSHDIITLVLGKKFIAAVPALKILSWVLALMFLSNLMEGVLIAGGRQRICTWVTVLVLVINVVFDFLLIPRWSIVGAGIATLIAEFTMTFLSLYFVQKLITGKRVFREALKPICSGTITFVILYLLKDVNFLWALILGSFSYIFFLILTKTITVEERLILLSAFKKKGQYLENIYN